MGAKSINLSYSIRLNEGAWSPFSKNTSRYFTHLNHGKYKLEVRAQDPEGNIDQTPATVSFEVKVVFWQTRWFYALVALIVILIASLIVALFMQRLKHNAKLDRTRLQFLTNVSHELRSPLALIINPLEKIISINNTDIQEGAKLALKNALRLNQLVEQLLDYRKLQTGGLNLELNQSDIVHFVILIVTEFKNLAENKRQTINFSSFSENYWTSFDQDALRKILDNLIINAIKYAPESAEIKVEIHPLGRGIQIFVEDNGPGILKEEQQRIFKALFYW